MKSEMDVHSPGEFQSHCQRVDDFLEGEWTNELGSQLVGLDSEGQVFGREPHLLSNLVDWTLRTVAVGRC